MLAIRAFWALMSRTRFTLRTGLDVDECRRRLEADCDAPEARGAQVLSSASDSEPSQKQFRGTVSDTGFTIALRRQSRHSTGSGTEFRGTFKTSDSGTIVIFVRDGKLGLRIAVVLGMLLLVAVVPEMRVGSPWFSHSPVLAQLGPYLFYGGAVALLLFVVAPVMSAVETWQLLRALRKTFGVVAPESDS